VLSRSVLTKVMGVDGRRVRLLDVEEDDAGLLIWVRPKFAHARRCPHCELRCPVYDAGRERRWRALDFARTRVFLVARPPRLSCPAHGVVVAAVPWARRSARHTRAFEQVAAWAAVQMSAKAAATLLRCSWRTIGTMVARVAADLAADRNGDGLDGLRRIGIDEISYRRGQRYLTVVVDHDTRRLVWAAPGRSHPTTHRFFDALGPDRTAALTHVSADSARWIVEPVRARAPQAVLCADPFHVVAWGLEAMDRVRLEVWKSLRAGLSRQGNGQPRKGQTRQMDTAMLALRKNPDGLSANQRAQLDWIVAAHPDIATAYQQKETLRALMRLPGEQGPAALEAWIATARASNLDPFIKLADRLDRHRDQILATLRCRLTNALVESVNTKIRLITRRAFGFRNVHALIALAQLSLGDQQPQLPT
jgi:transposase